MSSGFTHQPGIEPLNPQRARELIAGASGCCVLVLGDMVLDDHIIGGSRAVAREAPVPIIEMQSHYTVLGGATNVAANLQALGCEVIAAGVIGNDSNAQTLREHLETRAISGAGLVTDTSRKTSVKLRVWASENRQHSPRMMARIDTVDRRDLDSPIANALTARLEQLLPQADVLLISDYENGVVSTKVLSTALFLAQQHNLKVAVDAHGHLARFHGVTIVTPNQPEAEAELDESLTSAASIRSAASQLRKQLCADGVVITLGAAGMVVASTEAEPLIIPAGPQTIVVDPTGAGDTVAASVTVGLLAGGTFIESAQLAELAARLVVRQLGVAVPEIPDILAEAQQSHV